MRVAAELANTIAKALGFKGNFVQTLWNTARDAVTNFANAIQGIPQALQNCLQWAYNIVMNHPLVQALKWLGEQAANAFSVLGLGQSSPGKIVKAMKAELDWTQEAIEKSSLPGASAGLGSNIADVLILIWSLGMVVLLVMVVLVRWLIFISRILLLMMISVCRGLLIILLGS